MGLPCTVLVCVTVGYIQRRHHSPLSLSIMLIHHYSWSCLADGGVRAPVVPRHAHYRAQVREAQGMSMACV